MESLWAYLTIKQLIEEDLAGNFNGSDRTPKEKALELALRYSLVTPLTSLLVVKPPPPLPKHPARKFERNQQVQSAVNAPLIRRITVRKSMSTDTVSQPLPPFPPLPTLPPQHFNPYIVVDLKDAFGESETMNVPFSVRKRSRNRTNSNSTSLPIATSSVFSRTPTSKDADVPLTLGNITWLRENVTVRFKEVDYKLGKLKSGQ